MPRSASVVSREAYQMFVSFIFAAAMVAWGTSLLGLNPLLNNLAALPDAVGFEFIQTMPSEIAWGGILYGVVLICFYWIYAERLIPTYPPMSLWVLPVDLVVLSFMAGAASAWVHKQTFIFLAAATLVFLLIRFIEPARLEWKGQEKWTKWLMTQLGLLYFLFGIGLSLLLLGAHLFGGGIKPTGDFYNTLYTVVQIGMVLGILLTGFHAWFYGPSPTISPRPPIPSLTSDTYTPIRPPKLTPCYQIIPPDRLPIVADAVLKGEVRYRELLRLSSGQGALAAHLSSVHSYRDVETQAFIMAHHADEPGKDRVLEMTLRSMWVYLSHWFDDIFDYYRPEQLAGMDLGDNFSIVDTLEKLDPRCKDLWLSAIQDTTQLVGWKPDLLELGMRRLILGGPMLSPKCNDQNARFQAAHKAFVMRTLDRWASGDNVKRLVELVEKVPDRHLAYTSKVVVEIWDSFSEPATFPMSLLMGFFYAPGLLLHDYRAELDQGEILESPEDTVSSYKSTLEAVVKIIEGLPDGETRWMLKPVPMFLDCFRRVFKHSGADDLLMIYSRVLKLAHVDGA